MKKFLVAAGLAGALMAGATAPSMAAAMNKGSLGTFSGKKEASLSKGLNVSGTFDEYFTFKTKAFTEFTASVTNSVSSLSQFIKGLTISLYSGSKPTGTPLATDKDTGLPFKNGAQFVSASSSGGSNTYTVEISGMVGKSSPGLSFSISPVPLPSSVALFGVAVAGLGVAGAMRKRKVSVAA